MGKQRNPKGMGNYTKLSDGRIRWKQTIDGETRQLTARTMAELQEKIKKIADLPIIKEKYKVEDWFDKWLDIYIKPLKKAATYNQYNDIYKNHIKPIIGKRKITTIKSYDVQGIIAKMNEKELSSCTMKHARKIMNIAFSKAYKEKIIAENPVIDIDIPVKQAKTRKVLTIQELEKLFKSLENSRWIWSVRFMLVTGLRRGELLALKWFNVDFENKRLTVDESNSSTGLGDTKSSKAHYVPLSDVAIEYLGYQKKMLEAEYNPILHNEELKKTGLVFPNQSGLMLHPTSYYTLIARASKRVGLKASPHCLRHTFVYMAREKLSLKELQYILGHDESTTTLDIYGDIINDSTEKTASRIDEIFDKVNSEIEKIGNEKGKQKCKVIEFKRVK